jgi:hypothetical protein
MGVREPLEDPTATHGLCPAHYAALLPEGPDALRHVRTLQAYVRQREARGHGAATPPESN